MIRRCLILDTETTGLDPAKDSVIEIGAVLYSVEHATTLIQVSTLTHAVTENPAEAINRIPSSALRSLAERNPWSPAVGVDAFEALVNDADVIVAQRAEFDRAFLSGFWHSKPWACTKFDFSWPKQTREGESLVALALEHGIGVASAHRALADCQLIAALFDRMSSFGADLQQMFARAMRPKGIFMALVPFEEKDKAKSAGFQWDGATKRWTRRMAVEDAAALPFKTLLLEEVAA